MSRKFSNKEQPSKFKRTVKKAVLIGGMGVAALLGAETLEGSKRNYGKGNRQSLLDKNTDDNLEFLKEQAERKSDQRTEELRRFIAGKSLPGDELCEVGRKKIEIKLEPIPAEDLELNALHPDYTNDLPMDDKLENLHTQEIFSKLEKAGKYGAINYARKDDNATVFNVFYLPNSREYMEEKDVTVCALSATPDGQYIIYPDLESYDKPWKVVSEYELEKTLDEISAKKSKGVDPFSE